MSIYAIRNDATNHDIRKQWQKTVQRPGKIPSERLLYVCENCNKALPRRKDFKEVECVDD